MMTFLVLSSAVNAVVTIVIAVQALRPGHRLSSTVTR